MVHCLHRRSLARAVANAAFVDHLLDGCLVEGGVGVLLVALRVHDREEMKLGVHCLLVCRRSQQVLSPEDVRPSSRFFYLSYGS